MIEMRHNVLNVTSINSFIQIKGGVHNDCKDVLFVRALGADGDIIKRIQDMDQTLGLASHTGAIFYNRVTKLSKLTAMEDVQYYTKKYEEWLNNGKCEVTVRSSACKNEQFRRILSEACKKVEQMYAGYERNVTDTMKKNFIVKCLFWFDFVFSSDKYNWNEKWTVKLAVLNVLKKQEYLFWYMVSLCGNDVLMLQLSGDVELDKELQELSTAFKIGNFSDVKVECYNEAKIKETKNPVQHLNTKKRLEKTYEELAQLASSVVLIAIHDKHGEIAGTGSGIMIGRKGYILTNCHVINKGNVYSVKIEDDEEVYMTDEVIKYHSILDLAVIRINRELNPLPIYKGPDKLVRGQKVVAIGSPLGLFNSVSDGIISGFRTIDTVNMIQFTAPISSGSSGGALLNMYGELIGISTAGFDSGQNINLAVGYECIDMFVKGFTG